MTDTPMNGAPTNGAPITPEAFAAWAARLGLARFPADDLEALRAGWIGLQPQLARVRDAIGPDDAPPRPSFGPSPGSPPGPSPGPSPGRSR